MWGFLRAYRMEANEKDKQHVIDMMPKARLHLIRYFNEIVTRTKSQPNPFEARHAEQATRLALIHQLWTHVEVEQRATERTYGIKAGSLIGHETDLDMSSAEAGGLLQHGLCAGRRNYCAPSASKIRKQSGKNFAYE